MAEDVFEPQTRAKVDVPLRRAEATHVGLNVPREGKIEIVAPRIAELAGEVRRHRRVGNRAANKVPKARHTEDWKHNSIRIDRREANLPDVLANFLFGLRGPERNVQHAQTGRV